MSRVALLDINVLVALFDPEHAHHEAAHEWFAANRATGWATCPLTENGFVRVLSNPAYAPMPERPPALLGRLRAFCESGEHTFWPDTTHSSPSRTARVWRPARSLPATGSLNIWHHALRPVTISAT